MVIANKVRLRSIIHELLSMMDPVEMLNFNYREAA